MAVARDYTSPNDVNHPVTRQITTVEPSYFVQALLALSSADVAMIYSFSSDLTLSFFKSMELNKDQLCTSLASGHIESMPGLPDDVRVEVNKLLKPDLKRAQEVHQQLNKGSDSLAKHLWPNIQVGLEFLTGSQTSPLFTIFFIVLYKYFRSFTV